MEMMVYYKFANSSQWNQLVPANLLLGGSEPYFYLAMIFNEGNVCGDKLFEKNENKENENLKNNLNNEKNITKKIADDYEKIKEEQNRIKAPKSKMEAEIYFNSLSLNDYQKIKSEATKYLPEGLSEEELKNVIIDQIIRKYI